MESELAVINHRITHTVSCQNIVIRTRVLSYLFAEIFADAILIMQLLDVSVLFVSIQFI